MNHELVGLAFAAGMVAALNPCGFVMLPGYLALVVNREGRGQLGALGRAVTATAVMALGFLTVFGLFGLLAVSVASTIQRYLPYVTVVVGILLVALGVWLISGRELMIPAASGGSQWAPTARLGSMFGYGIGYAIASLSCTVGPFLAVTGSSLRTGSVATGLAVYAAYAGGLALVVGSLAVAVAVAGSALIGRMRRILPYVNRISGVILVAVGLYVANYGWFELRLLDGSGSAGAPVIEAAGRVQQALADWVYRHGAWPWLLTSAAVSSAVALARLHRRRRRRSGRESERLEWRP